MHDESGAQVAPDGSSRSIMLADSGSVAAQPPALGYDRPYATPSPSAPEYDHPGASYAAAPAHDRPHVTHPTPPGHTQASVTDPTAPDQGLYDRTFTKEEVQRLVDAATAPLLDEEVRLLQILIRRFVALGYDPPPPQGQPTVRQQQRAALIEKITVVGRAVDVLQRTLKTRQVLAADSPNELYQLLDEAAKYMNDPPPHDDIVIEEYVPGSLPT